MERDPSTVHVRSTFERPREPTVLVVAIAVFLGLAILKPWSFGASGGAPTGRPPARPTGSLDVAVVPSPSPRPHDDPNGMLCPSGDTEQVVLLERWAGNEVRSWIVATDRAVSGPLDPAVTRIAVYSGHVIGVGVCAPESIGGSVAAGARLHDVQVLSQAERGPQALDLGLPAPITATSATPDAAVLYGLAPAAPTEPSPRPIPVGSVRATPAAVDAASAARPWRPGSYVIAFVFPADPSARVRWLRIDILASDTPG